MGKSKRLRREREKGQRKHPLVKRASQRVAYACASGRHPPETTVPLPRNGRYPLAWACLSCGREWHYRRPGDLSRARATLAAASLLAGSAIPMPRRDNPRRPPAPTETIGPYTLPFWLDSHSSYVWDAERNMVADFCAGGINSGVIQGRGWGRLQYMDQGDKLHDAAHAAVVAIADGRLGKTTDQRQAIVNDLNQRWADEWPRQWAAKQGDQP